MNLYGVKLLYRYVVGGETFYEESILRVKAEGFGEAIALAEELQALRYWEFHTEGK